MMNLASISYEDFGKLRFLSFFPKTDAYQEDHEGGMETGIGLACTEGYLSTMFTSPVDQPWETVEMLLEFAADCPEREGNLLLDSLGLKIRKGMARAEIIAAMGPGKDLYPTLIGYVIGQRWPYYVHCGFTPEQGPVFGLDLQKRPR
jgi:hypothetical protein